MRAYIKPHALHSVPRPAGPLRHIGDSVASQLVHRPSRRRTFGCEVRVGVELELELELELEFEFEFEFEFEPEPELELEPELILFLELELEVEPEPKVELKLATELELWWILSMVPGCESISCEAEYTFEPAGRLLWRWCGAAVVVTTPDASSRLPSCEVGTR